MDYNSKEYKRSRAAYAAQCTFEYFVTLLVADAFFAKLLTHLGISDSVIGILTSLVSLAFIFQLFSIFIVQKIRNVKKTAIIFSSLFQLLFMFLYMIPFLPIAKGFTTAAVVACKLFAYFANYLIASIVYKWGNSFVDPAKRASYSAVKEMISLASGMVFTLVIGYIIDRFEAVGQIEKGFIFTAASIFILSICNFVSLMLIKKDDKPVEKAEYIPFKVVMTDLFGNKNFRNVIILSCIWYAAQYVSIGFLGVYKTNTLLYTVGTVQIINIVGNAFRFVFSIPFGKYSDKHSFVKGIKLALGIAAVAFASNIFCTPETRWMIIIYTILHAVCMAGVNQNFFNIIYSYVDSKYFVQASAIKNSIGGLFGFLVSLLSGYLLSFVQNCDNKIFGITVYGQQIQGLISFILVIAAIVFIKFTLEKEKIMKQ